VLKAVGFIKDEATGTLSLAQEAINVKLLQEVRTKLEAAMLAYERGGR